MHSGYFIQNRLGYSNMPILQINLLGRTTGTIVLKGKIFTLVNEKFHATIIKDSYQVEGNKLLFEQVFETKLYKFTVFSQFIKICSQYTACNAEALLDNLMSLRHMAKGEVKIAQFLTAGYSSYAILHQLIPRFKFHTPDKYGQKELVIFYLRIFIYLITI